MPRSAAAGSILGLLGASAVLAAPPEVVAQVPGADGLSPLLLALVAGVVASLPPLGWFGLSLVLDLIAAGKRAKAAQLRADGDPSNDGQAAVEDAHASVLERAAKRLPGGRGGAE